MAFAGYNQENHLLRYPAPLSRHMMMWLDEILHLLSTWNLPKEPVPIKRENGLPGQQTVRMVSTMVSFRGAKWISLPSTVGALMG